MTPTIEKRPGLGGIAFCLIAAIGYTTSNICMRQLAAMHCDTFWAVFNRELITPVFIGGWFIIQAARGRFSMPSFKGIAILAAVGLLIQLAGNVAIQWSMERVGLAVTIPTMFGAMITGGALIGRFWLGERVSRRSVAAIAILLAALALLGESAVAAGRSASETDAAGQNTYLIALGVAAAALGGTVYALLSAALRRAVTENMTPTAAAFVVTFMGVVAIGPICCRQLGTAVIAETPPGQYALMFAAGVFNLVGFLSLINGLQRTTVFHANAVNASQVAMAAVAGMVIFAEPLTVWLLLGVCLTIFGIFWINQPSEAVEEIPPP